MVKQLFKRGNTKNTMGEFRKISKPKKLWIKKNFNKITRKITKKETSNNSLYASNSVFRRVSHLARTAGESVDMSPRTNRQPHYEVK